MVHGPLGDSERGVYDQATADSAQELRALIRGGDMVILHDPQTAGLAAPIRAAGHECRRDCFVPDVHPCGRFTRAGRPARRHCAVGPPPGATVPLVVQVSRWDHVKDMGGVMRAFAEEVAPNTSAHLLLAGPSVTAVADDPEASRVLLECLEQWRLLPHAVRARIHLACLPMRDVEENAAIVNAIQRHGAVVTQKSLAEGFGLTVAEAMWKGRPVVGSAVGGIQDQIVAGESGILIDDPADLTAFGGAVRGLLDDPALADRMGSAAELRVNEHFLGGTHLERWGALIQKLRNC